MGFSDQNFVFLEVTTKRKLFDRMKFKGRLIASLPPAASYIQH